MMTCRHGSTNTSDPFWILTTRDAQRVCRTSFFSSSLGCYADPSWSDVLVRWKSNDQLCMCGMITQGYQIPLWTCPLLSLPVLQLRDTAERDPTTSLTRKQQQGTDIKPLMRHSKALCQLGKLARRKCKTGAPKPQ